MGKQRHSKQVIERAITGSSGLISTVAQRLGVSQKTVRNYLKKYPELDDLLSEEREMLLDFVESKLIKKVHEEDFRAIKFILSTKGQSRGYGKDGKVADSDGLTPEQLKEINTVRVEFVDFSEKGTE